jgi:quinol monooxygenase YgiN
MPLVIYVEFTVKAAAVERFHALILENARLSLENEPGCRRFDVLIDGAAANRIVLYEIYESPAAFDAHMATAHYKVFAAAADELLEGRRVERLVFLDARLDRDAERKTAQHPIA